MTSHSHGYQRPIPEITVPEGWEPMLAAWPEVGHAGLANAVVRTRDSGCLSVNVRSDDDCGAFAVSLRERLAGVTRSVAVSFSEARYMPRVVALLGALLGDVGYPADRTLGGPVSVTATGGVDQHEQWWHTDSTAWVIPNRWTILGLLHGDPELSDAATAILPWDELENAWSDDLWLRGELRSREFPWRSTYPHLTPLSAPIRGSALRWFRPALSDFIDNSTMRVAACHAVDTALRVAMRWYETVVAPTRILIFDNHAVLHRGPAVREHSTRSLLRLKVSGSPGG